MLEPRKNRRRLTKIQGLDHYLGQRHVRLRKNQTPPETPPLASGVSYCHYRYQAEGTWPSIIEGAKTVRLFGEEIAVQAQIHTLGGFSAHADQRGLLEWLSHFRNPNLEVFLVHGGEKVSLEFAQLVRDRFHFRTSVPQWGEQEFSLVRSSGCGGGLQTEREEEVEEERQPSSEGVSRLLRELDRSFKKLRRKLKRGRIKKN